MAKIDGKLVVVQIGDVQICTISDSLNLTTDMIETTTKCANGVKEFIPGERGATISLEGLYDPTLSYNLSEVFTAWNAGTALTIKYGETSVGGTYYSATGYFTSVTWTNTKNEAAGISAEIQITGLITENTVAGS